MMVPTPNCSSKFHTLLHRWVTSGSPPLSPFFFFFANKWVRTTNTTNKYVVRLSLPKPFVSYLLRRWLRSFIISHLLSFTHLSTCTRRYETSPPPKAIIKPGAELQPHLHWHHQSPQIHHHHHPRHPYFYHHHHSHSPITPLPTAAWIVTSVMMVSTSTHTQKASSRNWAFQWESELQNPLTQLRRIIYSAHRCPHCSLRNWKEN